MPDTKIPRNGARASNSVPRSAAFRTVEKTEKQVKNDDSRKAPRRAYDNRPSQETSNDAQAQKKRMLPGGAEVSDSIHRRIESLGLHSEASLSKDQPQERRGAKQKRFHETNNNAYDETLLNSFTCITSNSESDDASDGPQWKGFNRHAPAVFTTSKPVAEASSRQANLNTLSSGESRRRDGDSSSEEEVSTVPNYAIWLSPPKLEDFVDPVGSDDEDDMDLDLGFDDDEAKNPDQPAVKTAKIPYAKDSTFASRKEETSNLKSEAEQERLDRYLKRMAEEEKRGKRSKEMNTQPSILTSSLRNGENMYLNDMLPNEKASESASSILFETAEAEFDDEELVFTPVHMDWEGDKALKEMQHMNKKARKGRETKRDFIATTEPATQSKVQRAVRFSKSNLETSTNSSAEDPDSIGSQYGPDEMNITPSSHSNSIADSNFMQSSTTKRNSKRSRRHFSIRRSRLALPNSVHSLSIQRSFSKGRNEAYSKNMTFTMKCDMESALNIVASTCQHHLQLAVYKRHSGDKLRIENIHGGRLRVSLRFEGLPGEQRTSVEVRASKLDRDMFSRVREFFTMLVAQLGIDGHIAGNMFGAG